MIFEPPVRIISIEAETPLGRVPVADLPSLLICLLAEDCDGPYFCGVAVEPNAVDDPHLFLLALYWDVIDVLELCLCIMPI